MVSRSPLLRLEHLLEAGRICEPCARRLSRHAAQGLRRGFSSQTSAAPSIPSVRFDLGGRYFWANNTWRAGYPEKEASALDLRPSEGSRDPANGLAPSKTKFPRKDAGDISFPKTLCRRRGRTTRSSSNIPSDGSRSIPPDASSQLSSLSSELPPKSFRQSATALLSLSKPRLTFLMVLTTASAYTLFPVAVSPSSTSMSLSPVTLLNLTAGTTLSSACANALNMLIEPRHDAKMSRTRTRPLVRGLVSSRAALLFAVGTGASGVILLHYGVNPTVAFLSAANIVIYAGMYTPMKRLSVVNTWIGAIVGGVPPLMGWAAAAGQASSLASPTWQDLLLASDTSAGGWLLAALLFAWQFPHFNAISHTIRREYANAGYRMLASFNTRKNSLIALRYSLAMFPICAGLSAVGVTSWAFVASSGVVNAWLAREAMRFWKHEGGKGSARALFWASVWQLPLVLVLAMVQKKGLWERFVRGAVDEDELRTWQEDKLEHLPSEKIANSRE